ncbi:hypothetical protein ACHQM5_025241 [Ranunculus cassubicifolius]
MSWIAIFFLFLISVGPNHATATKRHLITFRSPNLYPESLTYDPHPSSQHFLVGSLRTRSIHSVDHDGNIQTLISDPNLPENVTIAGLAVDSVNRRLLAVIHAMEPLPPFNALAAYNLSSPHNRIFLSQFGYETVRQIANDVTVDFSGNAYITNSISNFIWKVNSQGEWSIFSKSPTFTAYPVPQDLPPSELPYHACGLNGIAYVSQGYFLVVQSNTGKLFKVNSETGRATTVLVNKDLFGADGISVRSDGVVVVVSQYKLWLLKSQDSWSEAVVYDEIALNTDKFPTSVVTKKDETKMYVLYGNVNEGVLGKGEREVFAIEEVESGKDVEDDMVFLFVLIGVCLAIFMYWRFQMGQLVKNMNRKMV